LCNDATSALSATVMTNEIYIYSTLYGISLLTTNDCRGIKSSSAVAKRPRDNLCLSVVSFINKKKRRAKSFIVSYVCNRIITACN